MHSRRRHNLVVQILNEFGGFFLQALGQFRYATVDAFGGLFYLAFEITPRFFSMRIID